VTVMDLPAFLGASHHLRVVIKLGKIHHELPQKGTVLHGIPFPGGAAEGEVISVKLHDGSSIVLKKADSDFDPTKRSSALGYLEKHRDLGEIPTGLLFIDEDWPEMHAIYGTAAKPLKAFTFEELNPGREALEKLQREMR